MFVSIKLSILRRGGEAHGSELFERLGGTYAPAVYILDAQGGLIRELQPFTQPADYLKQIKEGFQAHAKLRELMVASKESPMEVEAHWRVAEFARELRNDKTAVPAYLKVATLLERKTDRTDTETHRLGESLYRAIRFLAKGGSQHVHRWHIIAQHPEKCRELAERYFKVDAQNVSKFAEEIAVELAWAVSHDKDYENAQSVLEEAARTPAKTDEPGRLWFRRAALRERTGDRKGALAAYMRAAEVSPESIWGKSAEKRVEELEARKRPN